MGYGTAVAFMLAAFLIMFWYAIRRPRSDNSDSVIDKAIDANNIEVDGLVSGLDDDPREKHTADQLLRSYVAIVVDEVIRSEDRVVAPTIHLYSDIGVNRGFLVDTAYDPVGPSSYVPESYTQFGGDDKYALRFSKSIGVYALTIGAGTSWEVSVFFLEERASEVIDILKSHIEHNQLKCPETWEAYATELVQIHFPEYVTVNNGWPPHPTVAQRLKSAVAIVTDSIVALDNRTAVMCGWEYTDADNYQVVLSPTNLYSLDVNSCMPEAYLHFAGMGPAILGFNQPTGIYVLTISTSALTETSVFFNRAHVGEILDLLVAHVTSQDLPCPEDWEARARTLIMTEFPELTWEYESSTAPDSVEDIVKSHGFVIAHGEWSPLKWEKFNRVWAGTAFGKFDLIYDREDGPKNVDLGSFTSTEIDNATIFSLGMLTGRGNGAFGHLIMGTVAKTFIVVAFNVENIDQVPNIIAMHRDEFKIEYSHDEWPQLLQAAIAEYRAEHMKEEDLKRQLAVDDRNLPSAIELLNRDDVDLIIARGYLKDNTEETITEVWACQAGLEFDLIFSIVEGGPDGIDVDTLWFDVVDDIIRFRFIDITSSENREYYALELETGERDITRAVFKREKVGVVVDALIAHRRMIKAKYPQRWSTWCRELLGRHID